MSENYAVIDGRRVELTPEQIATLGIEIPKESPFERVGRYSRYYYIEYDGSVAMDCEEGSHGDAACFHNANYCTDEALLEQQALHETLNRRLWRYSMEHGGGKIDWKDSNQLKYHITLIGNPYHFVLGTTSRCYSLGSVYFLTGECAQAAFQQILKPFIKEHPNFVW